MQFFPVNQLVTTKFLSKDGIRLVSAHDPRRYIIKNYAFSAIEIFKSPEFFKKSVHVDLLSGELNRFDLFSLCACTNTFNTFRPEMRPTIRTKHTFGICSTGKNSIALTALIFRIWQRLSNPFARGIPQFFVPYFLDKNMTHVT